MNKKKWRDELDMLIDKNLNELIKETKEYDYAISKSKDKSKAQIWVALAIINQKIKNIHIESKEYKKKIPTDELDKIIETLEKL